MKRRVKLFLSIIAERMPPLVLPRIHYYGIILMLGALAGATLAANIAKPRGEDQELVWDGMVWALIGGIIGARLWHILTPTQTDVAGGLTTVSGVFGSTIDSLGGFTELLNQTAPMLMPTSVP